MTFLGLEARADLPRVSYSTALDLFVWISFVFIFATIIEVRNFRIRGSFPNRIFCVYKNINIALIM